MNRYPNEKNGAGEANCAAHSSRRVLLLFSVIYLFTYTGRFNLINHLDHFSGAMPAGIAPASAAAFVTFGGYAAGCFLNGFLLKKGGGRKAAAAGVLITLLMNAAAALCTHLPVALFFFLINNIFQSLIWLGGIRMIADECSREDSGVSVGIINFSSGLSHSVIYLVPQIFPFIYSNGIDWRIGFLFPLLLQTVCLAGFAFCPRTKDPGKNGDDEASFSRSRFKSFSRSRLPFWCAVACLSSICRYGLLKWIPLYYAGEIQTLLFAERYTQLVLPLGMAAGTLIVTIFTERFFQKNRAVVVVAMSAACAAIIFIFPAASGGFTALIGIFLSGFFLYAINGILWLTAIGDSPRPALAAGMMNGCAYLGALFEELFFPVIFTDIQNNSAIFLFMEALCILMMLCGAIILKKDLNKSLTNL